MSRSKKRFLLDRYISISVNFKLRFHGFAEQIVDGSNFPASDGHPWELIQDVRLFRKKAQCLLYFEGNFCRISTLMQLRVKKLTTFFLPGLLGV